MELLELSLFPSSSDPRRFHASASQVPAGTQFGEAAADCCLPFWTGEQDWSRTVIKVLDGTGGFQPEYFGEPGEQDWLEQAGFLRSDRAGFKFDYLDRIGQALYQSLFPPGSSLKEALNSALRCADSDLHLRLQFPAERSRLADYPWELLHDGREFLLLQQVRLSRYIAYEKSVPAIAPQETLRVLLVPARPQGLPGLSLAELGAIQAGLERAQESQRVSCKILPGSRKALNDYLTTCPPEKRPHVLHFDGHGQFGRRCRNPQCQRMHPGIRVEVCEACKAPLPPPQGYLVFETEQGQADYQSAREVAALLQRYQIMLVVLSACRSGMAVGGDSVFNGLAQNLIAQRIPAVVAMQYSVEATAAREFAAQFYRVLGNQDSLLTAVSQGMREMGVEGNQWYRPVLYLRWRDNEGGQLFTSPQPQIQPKTNSLMIDALKQQLQSLKAQFAAVVDQLNVSAGSGMVRLEQERNSLARKIEDIRSQLRQLGDNESDID